MLKGLFRQLIRPGERVDDADAELVRIRDLVREGALAQAAPPLDRYLKRYSQDPQALHLRGLIELGQRRHAAAAESIARAIEFDPDSPVYHANLGLVLWQLGRLDEARRHFEVAVDAQPSLVSACVNLSGILCALGAPRIARTRLEAALLHAAGMTPGDHALLWGAMSMLAEYLPEVDALECLERALRLTPAEESVNLLRFQPMAERCDWSYPARELAAFFERLAESADLSREIAVAPFLADCLPISRRARHAAARRTALIMQERVAAVDFTPARRGALHASQRIRLGYLSSDFHNHPTMHLLRGVLAAHDRSSFELHAFSAGRSDGSALRSEAEALFEHFHDIRTDSPLQTAQRIAQAGIDVLVDLKGYTGDARTAVMALRPAPVQVNYLGYPGTMAAPFIDYIIADTVVIPSGHEVWYDERVVSMPWSYQPNDDAQPVDTGPVSRADAGLPDTSMVYCSFNSTYKIEAEIFSVWMRILLATHDSVLWIYADREDARANLRREARARGVAPERLLFANTLPKARHLARLALADLFLDTHYVNAHTTASDSLWAGVPLITCPGDSFSSRVAASLLTAVGLPELVCADLDAYGALAIDLGCDRARRQALRAKLAGLRRTAPLFDTAGYTRDLESAFVTMHQMNLRGDSPAAFCVPRRRPGEER